MVNIKDIDSSIQVELLYATEHNFTKEKLYPVSVCILQKNTAKKLAAAQVQFLAYGLGLKVWDAYRPLKIQKRLWEAKPDPGYVTPPFLGSNHNRAAAVDLTLIDSKGKELLMPSGFDEFSPKAARNNRMSEKATKNLDCLTRVMAKNGFEPVEGEWWHFNDTDAGVYPLLDIALKDFKSRHVCPQ